MPLDTIEQYQIESEDERDGWRGPIGKLLTFTGFIVLANAFIVAMFFRHMLSLRYQILFAVIGGGVGVTGMLMRGNKREHVTTAILVSVAGIISTAVMAFLLDRFGLLAVAAVVFVVGFLVIKLEERAWKKL